MLLSFKTRLIIWLSIEVGHRLIRKRPDDRYVVSYPRSGSTWLRTILTNVIDPSANSNPDVFNALIPGVSIRNAAIINALASPRIIKSHSSFRKGLNQVVYITRDGRDALVSYYHYNHHDASLTFPQFFERYKKGYYGDYWHSNIVSWLTRGRELLGNNLLVVRYEDVKANEFAQTNNILNFLGIEHTAEQLENSLNLSKLENMRNIEAKRRGSLANPNSAFYRSGKAKQWPDYFTPDLLEQFTEISATAMQLAGYNLK